MEFGMCNLGERLFYTLLDEHEIERPSGVTSDIPEEAGVDLGEYNDSRGAAREREGDCAIVVSSRLFGCIEGTYTKRLQTTKQLGAEEWAPVATAKT